VASVDPLLVHALGSVGSGNTVTFLADAEGAASF
jgi:hypothetical protein